MLEKPQWLREWLDSPLLNFDIFNWHVHIGETVERAIDWVLDGINAVITWAEEISAWWEDFRQEVLDVFNILRGELAEFLDDPLAYLKKVFIDHILPWAEENIPFIATLYNWYVDFKAELELFFDDPIAYIRHAFEDHILPWAEENIPFIATLYNWYVDFKAELELFFDDPIAYIRHAFEDHILPWAEENIPFIAWLYFLFTEFRERIANFFSDDVWDDVVLFFTNPIEYIWSKFTDWFFGGA